MYVILCTLLPSACACVSTYSQNHDWKLPSEIITIWSNFNFYFDVRWVFCRRSSFNSFVRLCILFLLAPPFLLLNQEKSDKRTRTGYSPSYMCTRFVMTIMNVIFFVSIKCCLQLVQLIAFRLSSSLRLWMATCNGLSSWPVKLIWSSFERANSFGTVYLINWSPSVFFLAQMKLSPWFYSLNRSNDWFDK